MKEYSTISFREFGLLVLFDSLNSPSFLLICEEPKRTLFYCDGSRSRREKEKNWENSPINWLKRSIKVYTSRSCQVPNWLSNNKEKMVESETDSTKTLLKQGRKEQQKSESVRIPYTIGVRETQRANRGLTFFSVNLVLSDCFNCSNSNCITFHNRNIFINGAILNIKEWRIVESAYTFALYLYGPSFDTWAYAAPRNSTIFWKVCTGVVIFV